MMRKALEATAVLGLLAAAAPAAAEDLPFGRSLSVDVVGRISAKCQLVQGARGADFGDILDRRSGVSAGGAATLTFNLDCNSPTRIGLVSRHGGLVFQGADPTTDPDFARRLDYRVRARMGSAIGAGGLACASADMLREDAGAACRALADGPARGDGEIELTLERGGRPLLSGRYTDTLTLRVTPLLGGEGMAGGKE